MKQDDNKKETVFLLIINDKDWFWSHRLPLARAILARGWTLHLATNDASRDAKIREMGIIPHDLPAHTGSLNPLQQLRVFYNIWRAIRDVRPDILHAVTIRHAFYAGLALRFSGLPDTSGVFTIAGLGVLFDRGKKSLFLVRSVVVPLLKAAFGGKKRRIIFQNPDDAKKLITCGRLDENRCFLIRGSGVDPDEFPFKEEVKTQEPVVVLPSRLVKAKGIFEFVEAAQILKKRGVSAHFQLAGKLCMGNHDAIDEETVRAWQKDGAIEWVGWQSDMPSLLAGAHIVVLPSYREGVPKALLEAASMGRAIVTTDTPGCREVVEDGKTGFLVPVKNAKALAEALGKLIEDAELRQKMGRAGREKMLREGFTIQAVNEKTLAVYEDVLPARSSEVSLQP